jgi:hypothetical protein
LGTEQKSRRRSSNQSHASILPIFARRQQAKSKKPIPISSRRHFKTVGFQAEAAQGEASKTRELSPQGERLGFAKAVARL